MAPREARRASAVGEGHDTLSRQLARFVVKTRFEDLPRTDRRGVEDDRAGLDGGRLRRLEGSAGARDERGRAHSSAERRNAPS